MHYDLPIDVLRRREQRGLRRHRRPAIGRLPGRGQEREPPREYGGGQETGSVSPDSRATTHRRSTRRTALSWRANDVDTSSRRTSNAKVLKTSTSSSSTNHPRRRRDRGLSGRLSVRRRHPPGTRTRPLSARAPPRARRASTATPASSTSRPRGIRTTRSTLARSNSSGTRRQRVTRSDPGDLLIVIIAVILGRGIENQTASALTDGSSRYSAVKARNNHYQSLRAPARRYSASRSERPRSLSHNYFIVSSRRCIYADTTPPVRRGYRRRKSRRASPGVRRWSGRRPAGGGR